MLTQIEIKQRIRRVTVSLLLSIVVGISLIIPGGIYLYSNKCTPTVCHLESTDDDNCIVHYTTNMDHICILESGCESGNTTCYFSSQYLNECPTIRCSALNGWAVIILVSGLATVVFVPILFIMMEKPVKMYKSYYGIV